MKLNQKGIVLPTVLLISLILISLIAGQQFLIVGRMRQLKLLKDSYELQTMEVISLKHYLNQEKEDESMTFTFDQGTIDVMKQNDDQVLMIGKHKNGLSRQTPYLLPKQEETVQSPKEEGDSQAEKQQDANRDSEEKLAENSHLKASKPDKGVSAKKLEETEKSKEKEESAESESLEPSQ